MFSKWVALLPGLVLMMFGCETIDPAVEIPHYFHVEPYSIDNSLADSAVHSANITDVWVYVGSRLQGAYELPANIPVVPTGTQRITMYAGIKKGGISTARALYPFYAPYELGVLNLVGGNVDTIRPVTHYNDRPDPIFFSWNEQFEENLGSTIEMNPQSDTNLIIVSDPDQAFLGNRCGGLFLDEGQDFIEIISPDLTDLPKGEAPIYMEMNYKCDHEFVVGLYIHNKYEQFPIYVVKEQKEWNKIYFDFGEYVKSEASAENFNIFIGVQKRSDRSSVRIYLDNIKLLHY